MPVSPVRYPLAGTDEAGGKYSLEPGEEELAEQQPLAPAERPRARQSRYACRLGIAAEKLVELLQLGA